MDKYAIFLDFDSTLSHHNIISEENCATLRKVQEHGHYVFINTGRNFQGIEPIASKFHDFSGYISGLGSHITLGEEVLYHNYYDYETVEDAVKRFLATKYTCVITCVDRGYIINPAIEHLPYFTEIPSLEFFRENCRKERFQKIESPHTVWTPEEMEFWEYLGTVFVHEGYTECCPKGCSKARAIEIVIQKLGIRIENTIAIGDSANDMEMIEAAAIGVAMAEAPDFLKEKADFITKSCREHGVSYALSELLLNEKV